MNNNGKVWAWAWICTDRNNQDKQFIQKLKQFIQKLIHIEYKNKDNDDFLLLAEDKIFKFIQ